MKRLVNEILFGTNARISGLIALAIVGLIALGCSCGKDFNLSNLIGNSNSSSNNRNSEIVSSDDDSSSDEVPAESVVESLVKETTAEFADAVNSGDFSQIHANASSDFQNTYTVEEMTDAFKSYTEKKSVVVPILNRVAASDAAFTRPTSIRTEKSLQILMANGKFPTKPYNVRFDYEYVMRDGDWKLLKLIINIP
ncbi:hypothetical protein BH20ACI2_BH20ACI2_25520 [soil metagenome]